MNPYLQPGIVWIEKADGTEHEIQTIEESDELVTISPPFDELLAPENWDADWDRDPSGSPPVTSWYGSLRDFVEQFSPAEGAAV